MAYGSPIPPTSPGTGSIDGLNAQVDYATGPDGAELPSSVGQNDQGEPETPSDVNMVVDYAHSLGSEVNADTEVGHLVGDYAGPLASGPADSGNDTLNDEGVFPAAT